MSGLREALAADARFAKLVKSTQGAVPLEADFWAVLARGLFMTVEELAQAFSNPADAPRFWGEPNIAPAGIEALVAEAQIPENAIVRWRGEAPAALASIADAPRDAQGLWRAARVFKAGLPLMTEARRVEELLAPARERTMMVHEAEPVRADALDPVAEALAAWMREPRLIAPPHSPWEVMAGAIGAEPGAVREAVRRLVLGRRWRRFAFRFSPGALGLRAMLGGWAATEGAIDDLAARLAGCAAVGDVIARAPEPSSGVNLTAVLVAPDGALAREGLEVFAREAAAPPVLCLDLDVR